VSLQYRVQKKDSYTKSNNYCYTYW